MLRLLASLRRRLQADRRQAAVGTAGVVAGVTLTAAGVLPNPFTVEELISVVVCTLGREPRLTDTVKAVLGQTHADLELVVVDNDPASDRADTLLAGIDDPRLRIVREEERGLSAARNA